MLINRSLDQSQKAILSVLAMIISFFMGEIVSNMLEKPLPLVFQIESNLPSFSSPLYDLNTVTEEELCYLPGVGNSTAKKILFYRKKNLFFTSLDELKKVPNIGTKKFNKLKFFFYVKKSF